MSNNEKRSVCSIEEDDRTKIETLIFVSAIKLSDNILAEANQLLSVWGMTVLQYNTLRVLYLDDTDNDGLSNKEVGRGLYNRVPDVTRLLDRLADKGWIIRERDSINRRVVRSKITDIGAKLVESANKPLQELECQQLSSLTEEEKKTLATLLNKARVASKVN